MAASREIGAREVKRAELPLLQANEAGAFSGYASLFGVVDSGGDMVMAGAFARSLIKRGASGVKMLWQHQAAEPIGLWASIVEDSRGLKVEGRLDLSVARAREALSLMRKGAIDGLSIGFRTRRATTEKSSGVRRLHEIDLWEISVVTFPMLSQARIGAVKQSRNAALSVEALGAKLARLRTQRATLEFAQALRRLSEHS
ncbi:MAG: HK97 family phage prohead protease [Alphaproteobacteria bacterium]|nr:HK97 family phage prohead protease [Alphaproteobacteria bacterium]MBM3651516.1 HK97 family phage prohead protease [Alphaproteobacteria bacterium]